MYYKKKLGEFMKKVTYIVLGSIMVVIGAIGIVLPGLPTTIFLILAAYFFSHSSPDLYHRLMNNKTFGPIITNYIKHRGITSIDRKKALIAIWILFGVSIIISQSYLFGSILIVVGIIHTIFLFRLNLIIT